MSKHVDLRTGFARDRFSYIFFLLSTAYLVTSTFTAFLTAIYHSSLLNLKELLKVKVHC